MAALPKIEKTTLDDVDEKLIEEKKKEAFRHYLGMSIIGDECWRKLFYTYRSAQTREFNASGVRAIEDGYTQEAVMAKRLRMLPYIELYTEDPENPGQQIGFSLLLDHFRGHADGVIRGLLESPKTFHIWEHKSVNETKFNKLVALKKEKGEKQALQEWDPIYWNQAIIYMHCAQLTRHYLTVTTPGGRDYVSCRTEYNRSVAESIIAKAQSLIFDNWNIPARLSDKREFYLCKWCEHQGICHDGDFPLVHCKTCRYLEPVKDGKWNCLKHEKEIIEDMLFQGCDYHIYNPALIAAKLVEHQEDGCIYVTDKGFRFANIYNTGLPELKGELDAIYPSKHLFEKIKSVNNLTKEIVKIQQTFQGEIVDSASVPKKAWEKNKELRDI